MVWAVTFGCRISPACWSTSRSKRAGDNRGRPPRWRAIVRPAPQPSPCPCRGASRFSSAIISASVVNGPGCAGRTGGGGAARVPVSMAAGGETRIGRPRLPTASRRRWDRLSGSRYRRYRADPWQRKRDRSVVVVTPGGIWITTLTCVHSVGIGFFRLTGIFARDDPLGINLNGMIAVKREADHKSKGVSAG